MNQNLKITLGTLGAVGIGIESGYPHSAWVIPVSAGITAILAAFHVKPENPAR